MKHWLYSFLFFLFAIIIAATLFSSCANIVPPLGGPRDTLPPRLINAEPKDSTTRFSAKQITLTFNEFVTVDNPQDNVIIWPNPKNPPNIESNQKNFITIRLKDSLEPNTTYTINFGRGLKDINEGNVDSAFRYVFTTGTKLDHNTLKGKVVLAENGKTDSTLLVVLQTNLSDTAIRKNPPRYYTRLTGKGNFYFFNLPTDTFNVFVVPNDYTKRYDDSTKLFAFLPEPLVVSDTNTAPLTLYAYQEFKDTEKKPASNAPAPRATVKKPKTKKDSSFTVLANLDGGRQDFQKNMVLTFSDTLQSFDSTKFHFSDTNYNPLPGALSFTPDTTNTELSLAYQWKENTPYKLVIEKDAVTDSSGFTLAGNDTISFSTLRESDYGSIRMRFQNLDTSKHPVLLLVQNEKIVQSVSLTTFEWYQKFIRPGEYEIRLLYDTNRNGVWDAGSYDAKREPEVVRQLMYKGNNKISIRQNWDNETNITL